MKSHFCRILKITVCTFLILGMTGCWNSRELDTLSILMGMGLDKPGEPDQVQLTAQIAKPAEIKASIKESGANSGLAYLNIKSTSDTVFDALRGFTHMISRKVYLPHNQVIIFGRELAEEGVQKYIDFFVRDPETRINVWVMVAGGTAGEVLDVKSDFEKIPARNIADMIEAQKATSQTRAVRLIDFLASLMTKTTAPVAPLVQIIEEGEKKLLHISGTAVFKRDKLVGQLDETETRGLLWVVGEVKSGIIKVKCPEDTGKVSLEIIRASGKFTPVIKDGKPYFKIEIKEEGNLGAQSCPGNLALPSKIDFLVKEKAEAIKGEVMAAFKKARELNADIFGFGEAVHQRYPDIWKELEDKWDEVFPELKIEVNVNARLDLTGQINEPAGQEQE